MDHSVSLEEQVHDKHNPNEHFTPTLWAMARGGDWSNGPISHGGKVNRLMGIRVSNVHGVFLGPEIAHLQVGHLWRSKWRGPLKRCGPMEF